VSSLQKLSLTSTRVSNTDLLAIVSELPQLKTLSLGALGERQGSSATMGNSSALTMNSDTLVRLTDILANFQHLESVSLVGNAKLALTERTDAVVSDFISRVGRKCKVRTIKGRPRDEMDLRCCCSH
jgi:pyruvate/oxaloacetate carboxyltransferase